MDRLKAQSARDRQGVDDIVECVAVELSSQGGNTRISHVLQVQIQSVQGRGVCRRCEKRCRRRHTTAAANTFYGASRNGYRVRNAYPNFRLHACTAFSPQPVVLYPSSNLAIRGASRDQRPNPGPTFRLAQHNGDRPMRVASP
jgi:hypothetical protein